MERPSNPNECKSAQFAHTAVREERAAVRCAFTGCRRISNPREYGLRGASDRNGYVYSWAGQSPSKTFAATLPFSPEKTGYQDLDLPSIAEQQRQVGELAAAFCQGCPVGEKVDETPVDIS